MKVESFLMAYNALCALPHFPLQDSFACISSTPFLAHFAPALLVSVLFPEDCRNGSALVPLHLLFSLRGTLRYLSSSSCLLKFHHPLTFPCFLSCFIYLPSTDHILVTATVYLFCFISLSSHLEYKLPGGKDCCLSY